MDADSPRLPCLGALPLGARLGLTLLVVTLLGGYGVSGLHLAQHYDERDTLPGLTIDDITAAYHGVSSRAPLATALEAGHPAELGVDLLELKRAALLAWLDAGAPSAAFDDFELGELAPAEIIAADCLSCHSRAEAATRGTIALEYWDEVRAASISREVEPNPREVIAASIHAHAPSMAVILIVLTVLGAMTPWARAAGWLGAFGGAGLLADMTAQWFARDVAELAWVIVGGGAAMGAGTAFLGLLVVASMWRPGRRPGG